ncbi:MAG: ABC transporter permease [Candidatus Bathyarchaeia archaeon]
MNSILFSIANFWKEYKKHKTGIIGLALLSLLITISIFTLIFIPFDAYKQWHNPTYWSKYPKSVPPFWINYFLKSKLPEHTILNNPKLSLIKKPELKVVSHYYYLNFIYDSFPTDFILNFALKYYENPPMLEFLVKRPDKDLIVLTKTTLPPKPKDLLYYVYNSTIFSTERNLKVNVAQYIINKTGLMIGLDYIHPEVLIFAISDPSILQSGKAKVLKGNYEFLINFYLFNEKDEVLSSELIIGGKVFGLLGTDDLRRDLLMGILWGTPIALLIGLSVAFLAVLLGLSYGVISGYYGGGIDEFMMRISDIIYALPALPFLILLSLSMGRSIVYIIAYLVVFGWVGASKVARSIALQLKNIPYIEAVKLIGASNLRIMFKHIMPQITPYAIANIALSVPAAILTEAGLSFLGLGDPTLPTWGQILHDAQIYSAVIRGLWWWILSPGLMIAITGLSFVLIGNTIETILNPRRRA